MEKRLPLALLASLLFALIYIQMTAPPAPPDGEDAAAADEAAGPDAGGSVGAPPGAVPGGQVGAGAPSIPGGGDAARPDDVAPRVPAESVPVPFGERFRATFDTRGAVLDELSLTDYSLEPHGEPGLPLLGFVDRTVGSFLLTDFGNRFGLDRAVWTWDEVTTDDGRRRLVFTHDTGQGLIFTRTVTETGRPYTFDLDFQVTGTSNGSSDVCTLLLRGPAGVADSDYSSFASTPPTAVALLEDAEGRPELLHWAGSDLKEGKSRRVEGSARLVAAGAMTNYFASVLVPKEGTSVVQVYAQPVVDRVKIEAQVEERGPLTETERERLRAEIADDVRLNASVQLLLSHTWPKAGDPWRFGFTVYTGPKDRGLAATPDFAFLKPIIETSYGSMAWINRSLLAIMEFFERIFGNWGVAIILLTVLVKLLLFPLSRMQQVSMARYSAVMQKLKPELEALKEKYKNNKQKFNQENMKMMREHGVRPPLGGCLLMIPQMFIWISLFQVLRSSIELRHAGFVFWIHDLSAPDTMPFGFFGLDSIHLLPILMAAAMLLQMKNQPQAAAADPQQEQMQKVMAMIMPVMMLLFLYRYPSGLALYIFVSSLIGIFEFRVIRRLWPLPTAAAAPARVATDKPARPRGKGR